MTINESYNQKIYTNRERRDINTHIEGNYFEFWDSKANWVTVSDWHPNPLISLVKFNVVGYSQDKMSAFIQFIDTPDKRIFSVDFGMLELGKMSGFQAINSRRMKYKDYPPLLLGTGSVADREEFYKRFFGIETLIYSELDVRILSFPPEYQIEKLFAKRGLTTFVSI